MHELLLYWPFQSLWLCESQQAVKNSSRDGNAQPPDLPPEKSVCRWRSNSYTLSWGWHSPEHSIPVDPGSAQRFSWCALHVSSISRVTICSLDVLLSWFGTSLLFRVQVCCFLTCIQISQEAGQVVWYSHLLKNFPQFIVIHTVKGFSIVNKAESKEELNSLLMKVKEEMKKLA